LRTDYDRLPGLSPLLVRNLGLKKLKEVKDVKDVKDVKGVEA